MVIWQDNFLFDVYVCECTHSCEFNGEKMVSTRMRWMWNTKATGVSIIWLTQQMEMKLFEYVIVFVIKRYN